jgi:hypothetical protein
MTTPRPRQSETCGTCTNPYSDHLSARVRVAANFVEDPTYVTLKLCPGQLDDLATFVPSGEQYWPWPLRRGAS